MPKLRYFRLVLSLEPPWRLALSVRREELRFGGQARRVLTFATEEAARLRHNYIGTEHLLLGVIHDGQNSGAAVLESLGISLAGVRQQVEQIIGEGWDERNRAIPYTPRANRVLQLSRREALRLGDRLAGGDHLLLGLIGEGEGVAAQVLLRFGADLDRVRRQVSVLAQDAQDEARGQPLGPAPDPDHTDLHSVHYRLRPPGRGCQHLQPCAGRRRRGSGPACDSGAA